MTYTFVHATDFLVCNLEWSISGMGEDVVIQIRYLILAFGLRSGE